MNNVLILGGSKIKRELAHSVLQWYIKKYLTRYKNLDITVQIKRLADDYQGLCFRVDKKEFVLDISISLSLKDTCIALLHECVHMKQNLKNELKYTGFSVLWKGVDHKDTDYYSQPWEVEAIKLEEVLFKAYKSDCSQEFI